MGMLINSVDKKLKRCFSQKMLIFQIFFFLLRKLIFFLKLDTMECSNVYQSAWQTDNMFWGILDKNEIKFYFLTHSTFTRLVPNQRYSEVLQNLAFDNHSRFKGRHTIIYNWITMKCSESVNKCLPNIFQLTQQSLIRNYKRYWIFHRCFVRPYDATS